MGPGSKTSHAYQYYCDHNLSDDVDMTFTLIRICLSAKS